MSEVTVGLSVDEQDKIAAYHKAIDDRQKGVVKVAERVPADAGMAEPSEMPSGDMEPDQPMQSVLSDLTPGAMPRRAMNAGAKEAPEVAVEEMPRPPMN